MTRNGTAAVETIRTAREDAREEPQAPPARVAADDLAELRDVLTRMQQCMDAFEVAVAKNAEARMARDAAIRAQAAHEQVMARLARQYSLTPADRVEDDGAITRG